MYLFIYLCLFFKNERKSFLLSSLGKYKRIILLKYQTMKNYNFFFVSPYLCKEIISKITIKMRNIIILKYQCSQNYIPIYLKV